VESFVRLAYPAKSRKGVVICVPQLDSSSVNTMPQGFLEIQKVSRSSVQ
jgi:hypothetical protein